MMNFFSKMPIYMKYYDQSVKNFCPKLANTLTYSVTDLIQETNYNPYDKQSYVPLSKKFSNPVINSSSVNATAFLFFPPTDTMWEKSNSSKSSTLHLK